MSAVPSAKYKVPTTALKDGCVCVNVAADKNFGADVRDKVRPNRCILLPSSANEVRTLQASLYVPSVGKVTILMLLRNL